MARLSPRMGILFRFLLVAYGGQRTFSFRNERRVDERSVVRGGATTHTRNIENVYEIFLCMRYQSFNPCR